MRHWGIELGVTEYVKVDTSTNAKESPRIQRNTKMNKIHYKEDEDEDTDDKDNREGDRVPASVDPADETDNDEEKYGKHFGIVLMPCNILTNVFVRGSFLAGVGKYSTDS